MTVEQLQPTGDWKVVLVDGVSIGHFTLWCMLGQHAQLPCVVASVVLILCIDGFVAVIGFQTTLTEQYLSDDQNDLKLTTRHAGLGHDVSLGGSQGLYRRVMGHYVLEHRPWHTDGYLPVSTESYMRVGGCLCA